MDDYAHHPTEVAALAGAAHARFPGRRIVALFQPHTYARSMYLLEGWKTCFRDFDRLFILETYAAREPLSSGLNAKQLAEYLTDPPATYCADPAAAVEALASELQVRRRLLHRGRRRRQLRRPRAFATPAIVRFATMTHHEPWEDSSMPECQPAPSAVAPVAAPTARACPSAR